MLINRGEILKKVATEGAKKVQISRLAKLTGYDRTTVYQHFKNPNLDYSIILKYGKALKHDFSKEFPELMEFASILEEPLSEYKPLTVSEALRERDYWKDKYIQLLEKHTELITSQLVKHGTTI